MKRIIQTLVFSLIFSNLFSQSISNLDEKNGFKDFKLGSTLDSYNSSIRLLATFPDKSKIYLYTGSCCKTLFSYSLDTIQLRFFENKLVGIYLNTQYFRKPTKNPNPSYEELAAFRKDDFESIKNSFTQLFGKPTSADYSEKSVDAVTYEWKGNKVVLFSIYQNYGLKGGDRNFVGVLDKNYFDKAKQSEF